MQPLSSLPWLYLEVYLEHVGSTCPRLGHTVCSISNETQLNDSTPLPNSGIDIVPSTLDIRLVFYKSIRICPFSSKQNLNEENFFYLRLPILLPLYFCAIDPFHCIYIYIYMSILFSLAPSSSPSSSFTSLPRIALFIISFYRSLSLALSLHIKYTRDLRISRIIEREQFRKKT